MLGADASDNDDDNDDDDDDDEEEDGSGDDEEEAAAAAVALGDTFVFALTLAGPLLFAVFNIDLGVEQLLPLPPPLALRACVCARDWDE